MTKELFRVPVTCGDIVRFDPDKMVIVIERSESKPKWKDVTKECYTELKESSGSSGHYVAIYHKNERIFILGTKVVPQKSGEYKMEVPKDARISFKIYKKEKQ